MGENIDTNQPVSHKRRNIIIIVVVAIVIAALVAAFFIARHYGKSADKTPVVTDGSELAELHVFPPIDFADSLYYKKTVVSYEDESPRDVFYYEKDSLGQPTDVRVHETHYYPGEQKYIDGNLSQSQRDGLWYAYHKNGNVQTMAHYKNGKEDGRYTVYHENGSVYYTGFYKNGVRVGEWKFYDEKEKLVRTENFDEKK